MAFAVRLIFIVGSPRIAEAMHRKRKPLRHDRKAYPGKRGTRSTQSAGNILYQSLFFKAQEPFNY